METITIIQIVGIIIWMIYFLMEFIRWWNKRKENTQYGPISGCHVPMPKPPKPPLLNIHLLLVNDKIVCAYKDHDKASEQLKLLHNSVDKIEIRELKLK